MTQVFFLHASVHNLHGVTAWKEVRRLQYAPWNWSYRWGKLPRGCSGSNTGPLKERLVLRLSSSRTVYFNIDTISSLKTQRHSAAEATRAQALLSRMLVKSIYPHLHHFD